MRTTQARAAVPAQRDLFDSVATPASLWHLQTRREELVDLLADFLWQVARHSATEQPEASHEQDHA